ncbi:MAG: endonuclease III [bacterium]|nr:endonuclease III [bacterium]
MNDLKKLKARGKKIVELFELEYPDAVCSLISRNAFELLISTRLSAQCTDARVNLVTPALFEKYPDAESLSKAKLGDVEKLIKSCGLYKTKAKDLIGIGKTLVEKFNGCVPDSIELLLTLPGIGRKTANLVCGDIFGQPAVVADTHFIRICNRIGFLSTKNPLTVEKIMREILPPDKSNDFCHRTVLHGRAICKARKPECNKCCINKLCEKNI